MKIRLPHRDRSPRKISDSLGSAGPVREDRPIVPRNLKDVTTLTPLHVGVILTKYQQGVEDDGTVVLKDCRQVVFRLKGYSSLVRIEALTPTGQLTWRLRLVDHATGAPVSRIIDLDESECTHRARSVNRSVLAATTP